jgi:hypothetical protein
MPARLDSFDRRPNMIDDHACIPLVARAKPLAACSIAMRQLH